MPEGQRSIGGKQSKHTCMLTGHYRLHYFIWARVRVNIGPIRIFNKTKRSSRRPGIFQVRSNQKISTMEMEMETASPLVRLCLEEACKSRDAVGRWRLQRRSLERLPSHLADALLRELLLRRLLFPSLLE